MDAQIDSVVREARAAGRSVLLESEGYRILEAAGIPVPRRLWIPAPGRLPDTPLPGDRVVLKVVSSRVLHKSDVGGVRVLENRPEAVARGLREMAQRFAAEEPEGFLLLEHVPHETGPGGELLLGVRATADFGPVVTLGAGGIYAEALAGALRPGAETSILSPGLLSPDRMAATLGRNAWIPMLTGALRGQAPRIPLAALIALLERALAFAARYVPSRFAEFEVNPLAFGDDGPVALDVLARLAGEAPPAAPPRPLEKMDRLLRPRRIAVLGVSERMNPGRIIVRNVLREGFSPRDLFIVKPGLAELDGCPCVPDLASLPAPVDLAVLAVGAAHVPDLMDEILDGGRAESVIVIPGGLGEREGSGALADRVAGRIAASRGTEGKGPLVNGGNCLGVRSRPGRYNTLFIPAHKLPPSESAEAPLALISQSGAFAVARASRLSLLNPRYVVTLGNQIDLTVGDYLLHLAGDPAVRVFACYVEGFKAGDGRRWLEAAEAIRASGRTVILYRAGRTAAGASASASHTAAIAGDYAVTRELARQTGAILTESLGEFEDLVRLATLLHDRTPAGRGLGAVSNAGFECVALADSLGGFGLAAFTDGTRAKLESILAAERLGAIVGVTHPLDLTPMTGDRGFVAAADAVLADPQVHAAVIGCVPLTGAMQTLPRGAGHDEDLLDPGGTVAGLGALWSRTTKPWVVAVDAGALYDPFAHALEATGLPVFRHVDRALRSLDRWTSHRLGEDA